MEKFKKLRINEKILKAIEAEGFKEPTTIQEKSIPLILEGRDVIGSAATGSGKTLAFGAGFLAKIEKGKGIQALILVPTRELAEQVAGRLEAFSKYLSINVSAIYGGVSIEPQIRKLSNLEVVVGTPGRILDHIRQKSINLSHIKFLVLDEADRMFDMGFIEDVDKIISTCPRDRQTLLFSATISAEIEHITKKYMKHPVYAEADNAVDPSKLHQIFYDISIDKKFSLLVHLLKKEREGLVMVFSNTRRNTDFLARNLKRYNIHALAIHGGLTQNKRSNIMRDFHSNEALILICTDVAARGLDIKNVSHVYNYDIPKTKTEYIHRIGRTARAGKEGIAVNLVSQKDYENFRRISEKSSFKIINEAVPEIESLFVNFKSDNSGRYRHDRQGNRGFKREDRRGGQKHFIGFRRKRFDRHRQENRRSRFNRVKQDGGRKFNKGRRDFYGDKSRYDRSRGFKNNNFQTGNRFQTSPRDDWRKRTDGEGRSSGHGSFGGNKSGFQKGNREFRGRFGSGSNRSQHRRRF